MFSSVRLCSTINCKTRERREGETEGRDGRERREAETGGRDGRQRREAETGGGNYLVLADVMNLKGPPDCGCIFSPAFCRSQNLGHNIV